MEEMRFEIGDKVKAKGHISCDGRMMLEEGKETIVKDVRYCPNCGKQYISFTTETSIHNLVKCDVKDCNEFIPSKHRIWADPNHFDFIEGKEIFCEDEEDNDREMPAKKTRKIETLEDKLECAIENEDYLLAAQLRDQIKEKNENHS